MIERAISVQQTFFVGFRKLNPTYEPETVRVYAADGGQHEYRIFGIAEVEVQGRVCQVRAIELPHGAEPLLGPFPLKRWTGTFLRRKRNLFPIQGLPGAYGHILNINH